MRSRQPLAAVRLLRRRLEAEKASVLLPVTAHLAPPLNTRCGVALRNTMQPTPSDTAALLIHKRLLCVIIHSGFI